MPARRPVIEPSSVERWLHMAGVAIVVVAGLAALAIAIALNGGITGLLVGAIAAAGVACTSLFYFAAAEILQRLRTAEERDRARVSGPPDPVPVQAPTPVSGERRFR